MQVVKGLYNWRFMRMMRKRGVTFSKNGPCPKWKPRSGWDSPEKIRVCGIVDDYVEAYLRERGAWCDPEEAELLLFDDKAVRSAGDMESMCRSAVEDVPIVLWLHRSSETEVAPEVADMATCLVCSGTATLEKAVNLQLQELIDMRECNPIGHGMQNMKVSVGVVLDQVVSGVFWERTMTAVERWAKREDLAIWCANKDVTQMRGFWRNLALCQAAVGPTLEVEKTDLEITAQLMINLTSHPISDREKLSRAAQGQIWLDAVYEQDGIYVTEPINGVRMTVDEFLEKALEEHGFIEKMRTRLIRKVFSQNSLPMQLNQITQYVFQKSYYVPGVSILVVSNKPEFFDKILANFRRQQLERKELVVVFHSKEIVTREQIREMLAKVAVDEKVQIHYRDANHISFGYCINDGVTLTSMEYVAKFDDDDYYAPHFLSDILPAFYYTDAGVCGRVTFHTFLEESQALAVRKPGNEYIYCKFLPGATIVAHRDVFREAMFRDVPSDIDGKFGVDCTAAGIRMFAVDSYQLLVMRVADKSKHTWRAKDSVILNQSLPAYYELGTRLETVSAYYQEFFPVTTVDCAIDYITV